MRIQLCRGRALRLAVVSAAVAALGGRIAVAQEGPADPSETQRDRPERRVAESAAPDGAGAQRIEATGGWAAAAEAPAAREVDARADLEPVQRSGAHGTVSFLARDDGDMTIVAIVEGLEPGRHGFHIHEVGDCSAPDATSAGGHFSPADDPHGAPTDPAAAHHAGDLGNIVAAETGSVRAQMEDAQLELEGELGILGRAVIVHRMPDDLESQPAGSAGQRVACGVIRRVDDAAVRPDDGPGAAVPGYDDLDADDDAWLTREETQGVAGVDFDAADTDEDGVLSRREYDQHVAE